MQAQIISHESSSKASVAPRKATVEDLVDLTFPVTLFEVAKRFAGDQLIDLLVLPVTITGFVEGSLKLGAKAHVEGYDNCGDTFSAHPANFYLTEGDALNALPVAREEAGLLEPIPASDELLSRIVLPVTLYEVVKIMRGSKPVDGYVSTVLVLRHSVDRPEEARMTITAIDSDGERFRGVANDYYMTEYGARAALDAALEEAVTDLSDEEDLCGSCGEELDLDGYDGLCGNCADAEDSCELH